MPVKRRTVRRGVADVHCDEAYWGEPVRFVPFNQGRFRATGRHRTKDYRSGLRRHDEARLILRSRFWGSNPGRIGSKPKADGRTSLKEIALMKHVTCVSKKPQAAQTLLEVKLDFIPVAFGRLAQLNYDKNVAL